MGIAPVKLSDIIALPSTVSDHTFTVNSPENLLLLSMMNASEGQLTMLAGSLSDKLC